MIHKSPDKVQKERFAKNPNEAIDYDYIHGRVYSRSTPKDFGINSKKIKKKKK
jgi:hypothetical protein